MLQLGQGGVIPTTGDEVYANTYDIDITLDASASNIWNGNATGSSGGSFRLDSGVTLHSNFKGYNYSGEALVIHSASSGISRIVGDTRAAYAGSALSKTGTGELQITGSVAGAYQYGGTAISMGGGTLNILGNIESGTGNSGYTGYPIYCTGGTTTIHGNVQGNNSNITSYIYVINTAKIYVYGNITSGATNVYTIRLDNNNAFCFVSGSVSNSTNGNTCVFVDDNKSPNVIIHGNIENSNSGVQAIYSRKLFYKNTGPISSSVATYNIDSAIAASPRTMFTSDANADSPSTSNVRSGITYGNASSLTGTLVVPSASNVSKGVIFDNGTVGTAEASGEDLLNAISSNSDALATRLRTVSTVETTGGQLSALL